jgi:tripartite-type tricarboxylate transporter receptor subunit TctC
MRSALVTLAALCAPLMSAPAIAQPTELPKAITIVVPFPPGGSNDIFARLLAQKLAPKLGAAIVVDNKGGAGGTIGAAQVARAAPNGATLMLTSSTFTTSGAVQPNIPYDPIAGFTPIAQLAKGAMLLIVAKEAPFQTPAELIKAAGAEKGKLTYGTAGVGSINHLATEMLSTAARIEMTHVPYKGISQAIFDIIGGRVEASIASFPSALTQIKAGKVKALAVTSAARSEFAPELAPLAETVPGYAVELWWGIMGPAKMPADVVARLNREIVALAAEPDMKERFAAEGAAPTPISPAAFGAVIKSELELWKKIAQERKITAE